MCLTELNKLADFVGNCAVAFFVIDPKEDFCQQIDTSVEAEPPTAMQPQLFGDSQSPKD